MAFTDIILTREKPLHPLYEILNGAPEARALVPVPSGIGVWSGTPDLAWATQESRFRLLFINTDQAVEFALCRPNEVPAGVVAIPLHVPSGGVGCYCGLIDRETRVFVRLLA